MTGESSICIYYNTFHFVGVPARVHYDSAGTIFLVDTEDYGGQVGVKEADGSLNISPEGSKRVNGGQLKCRSAEMSLELEFVEPMLVHPSTIYIQ